MKFLPNALSSLRIILAVALIPFFREPFRTLPISLYIVAGLTDAIDGPLSRKIRGAQSAFGARLDGFADLLLIGISFFVFVPAMNVFASIFWLFLGAFSFKIASVLIGFIRFRQVTTTHTIANKLFAIAWFFVPVLYFFLSVSFGLDVYISLGVYFIFIFIFALLATAEEIGILLLLKEPDNDIKSIFHVKESNRQSLEG